MIHYNDDFGSAENGKERFPRALTPEEKGTDYQEEFGMDKKTLRSYYEIMYGEVKNTEQILRDLFEDQTLKLFGCDLVARPGMDIPDRIEFYAMDGKLRDVRGCIRIVGNSVNVDELMAQFQRDIRQFTRYAGKGRLTRILELVSSDQDKIGDGRNYHKYTLSALEPNGTINTRCEVVYLSRDKIRKSMI